MDDKTSKHTITLNDAQVFDCHEQSYLRESAAHVTKRTIAKKFDFSFQMNVDIFFNVDYAISAGRI